MIKLIKDVIQKNLLVQRHSVGCLDAYELLDIHTQFIVTLHPQMTKFAGNMAALYQQPYNQLNCGSHDDARMKMYGSCHNFNMNWHRCMVLIGAKLASHCVTERSFTFLHVPSRIACSTTEKIFPLFVLKIEKFRIKYIFGTNLRRKKLSCVTIVQLGAV